MDAPRHSDNLDASSIYLFSRSFAVTIQQQVSEISNIVPRERNAADL